MTRKFRFTIGLFILVSALVFSSGVYAADIEACKKADSEITGEAKRFSLISRSNKVGGAFTDIGCAILHRRTLCASETVEFDESAEVYDYNTGEAIPFETSFYVSGSGVQTPAGYGIIAFKDRASAEKLASGGKGKVLKFYDLTIMNIK